MTIKKEKNLKEFEFWGPAQRIADLLLNEEFDAIEQHLEELYPEGIGETELNDLFAYYTDFVLEIIGKTEEEILARDS